jgi:vitamin B12 transporter
MLSPGRLLALATIVVARPAAAQLDTVQLETLTVTATRIPIAESAVASTITVIRGEELRAQGIGKVLEAVKSVSGLTVAESGSFGGVTSLFLRGGESDYVQVLVDGVPVNQPGGAYDLAHLTTDNIERIEILRGPASVLYGSDATTGVVQIFTRRGHGGMQLSGSVRGGTYGSVEFGADIAGSSGSTSYSLAFSHFDTDGVNDSVETISGRHFRNDYSNTVMSGLIQLHPDDRSDMTFSLQYRDSEYHFPTDFSGNIVDENSFSLDEATTFGIDVGRFFTDRFEARLLLASNVTTGGTDDAQDNGADTLGFYAFKSVQDLSRQSAEIRTNFYLDDGWVLTTGAVFEQQEERSINESDSEFGPSTGSTSEERSNQGYYVQALADMAPFTVVAGARLDDNQAFGSFATYRAGAAYRISSGTKVRASLGRSFKAPTFLENFGGGFVAGNPDLDPERSFLWEGGLDQSLLGGRVVLSGTYFDQTFSDLIQFTFDTPNPGDPNYFNVAEADASGVEVEATIEPVTGLRIAGNYTYLRTRVINSGFDTEPGAVFVDGERLLRRPTHSFNVTADYTGWERGGVGVTLNRVGSRDDRDFAAFPVEPVVLDAYTTVALSGQLNVLQGGAMGSKLAWTFRVENLFDERYETVLGFPARGRTVLVGARVVR